MAQRPEDPTERAPGLAAQILLTSLGVGVLAGMIEICWSYLVPIFTTQWRDALPASADTLLSFCVAAVVTDGVLVLLGGILLLIVLTAFARAARVSGRSARLRIFARAAILGGTACYLFNGGIALFVLCSSHEETAAHRVIVAAGSVLLLVLALLGSVALEAARRRHRAAPAAVWFAALVILLVVTAPAFWHHRMSAGPEREISITTEGPRPNILLVTLDTLRSDYVGCYGHPWIKTPTLDQLARDGLVFDAAISQAPSTTPSHCSLMTSVYPFDHGAENGRPMSADLITLADVLRAHGYETTAFTSATTTRSINTGLQQGFDRYVDSLVSWSEVFGRDELQHLVFFYLAGFTQETQIPGEVVTDRALRWLEHRAEHPFFTWLHYFDPHEPYGSPPPFHGLYDGFVADGLPMAAERQRYAEDITHADFELGRFIDALKQKDLYDGALIIVTSDHGEAFGEKHAHISETGHGHYLSDVTQRVPLVIKPAGANPTGRRVARQVELIDLAPTVLDLLGIECPRGFRGSSFAALIGGNHPAYADRYAYAFNTVRVVPAGAEPDEVYVQQLAVRSQEWKYIARPGLEQAELYDLFQDPLERTSLADEHARITAELHARVMPFWDPQRDGSSDPREGLGPALVRELQALGYLGGTDDE